MMTKTRLAIASRWPERAKASFKRTVLENPHENCLYDVINGEEKDASDPAEPDLCRQSLPHQRWLSDEPCKARRR